MNGRAKVVVSMLIWGSVGIFGRLSGLSGLGVAFARVFLGALVLFMVIGLTRMELLRELPMIFRSNWKPLLGLGTALALNWAFLFTAFNYTTIANAVMVYYIAPILATLMSWRFLGETIDRKTLSLIILAFLGLILIMSGQEISFENRDFVGILLAFTAAFFYAMIPNLGRFLKEVDGKILTLSQLGIASFVLLPFVLLQDVGKPVWWTVLVLVLIHTVFALFLYMEGLKEVEVKDAALLSYLDPASAVVYAFLVFGEVPGTRTVIGGVLILLASALDALRR
ncbi:permease, drug/metabolite transporter (DMT) superfamily [Thermococcus kodakarensis KOD1]|uniref:Permease, drug/metabolite transporter (DMT) superfamily n=1 Tax=Thermococcus kodakarensis (strain ATCC BAA-918 / JCM 12380 / KOD1) TaxID=69014 RepID=Q5JJ71_THEKO|nr:EamA family transporter [Thermococcus kodakarensis]WCN27701.1 EamA family transporter [Thermococcus kodakarensis]WCN29994.1 EamA family transporter [Thermococcus kodakarensis]BAD85981.1 permease, drug/metabolite transporter (DMT) superfamily [Thermococcus kodakarensis KOD1]